MNGIKGFYNRNTILGFGMYKGYTVGVVFLFDSSYIDWCINNIDGFYIEDLDYLIEHKVIYNNRGHISSSEALIDTYKEYQQFAEKVEFTEQCHFTLETQIKNKSTGQILTAFIDNTEALMDEAGYVPGYRSRYTDDSYDLRSWEDVANEEMGEPPAWDAIDNEF